ncbi:MAG: hypothetical protein AB7F98_18965 [Novosphingobium sp.]
MPQPPIQYPTSYSVSYAVAFSDMAGNSLLVSPDAPLPVTIGQPAGTTPLTGTAVASVVVGPYAPVAGRPVMLSLQGTWQGTVALRRSTDGGTAWGQFAGNACEPVWEESESIARLYLDIQIASGSVSYRLAQ